MHGFVEMLESVTRVHNTSSISLRDFLVKLYFILFSYC